MKNILVPIHDDPGQEARLQAALDLTRALRGHLTLLEIIHPPQVPPEVTMAAGYDQLVATERRVADINRLHLEERLAVEDVAWDCVEAVADPVTAIRNALGLADLIVLNRKLDHPGGLNWSKVASATLLESRKPIVAVPEDTRGFGASGHAVVAWDGSAQASGALAAAVPLLLVASTVTVVEIDDGSVETPGEEAAAYLYRHGIHAELTKMEPAAQGTANTLLDTVEKLGAAYIVMGGYGRTRLSEALFGGTTHTMLRTSPVPLLIVH